MAVPTAYSSIGIWILHSTMSSALVQLGVLGFAASLPRVWADVKVDASCKSNKWMVNQLGQDPCTVGAKLQAQCLGGDFEIAPLGRKDVYPGPLQGQSNACTCSSVTYSVISACAACQNDMWLRWAHWSANCTRTDISIATYKPPFPQDITVPLWAFEDVTAAGAWNIRDALKIHNKGLPDINAASLSPSPPNTTASSPAPSSTSSQVSSNSGNTNNQGGGDNNNDDGDQEGDQDGDDGDHNNSPSSNNAGAIAGGVIGGMVGLSVLVLAAICYNKRKKKYKYPRARVFFDAPDDHSVRDRPGRQMAQSPVPTVEPYVIPSRGVDSPTNYHSRDPSSPSNFLTAAPSTVSANHSHSYLSSPKSPIPSPPPSNTAYGHAAIYGNGVATHAGGAAGRYTGAAEV